MDEIVLGMVGWDEHRLGPNIISKRALARGGNEWSHIQSNAQLPGVVVQFGCGPFGGNPQGVVVSDVDGTIGFDLGKRVPTRLLGDV